MKRLDHYELQELLGQGGMGKIYRALDRRLQRTVALKLLDEAIAAQPQAAARFRREARLSAALRHPNIVTVFDCAPENASVCYLVTELIVGGSLRQQMSEGPWPAALAALVLLPIARALGAAHARGIVHRDVKPDNILIDVQDQTAPVKLTDFGIAVALTEPRLTSTSSLSGSVAYLAPEQLERSEVTPAIDLWALGVTLYELIFGRLPFSGATIGEVVTQILRSPLDLPPGVLPSTVEHIARRCLERDPGARFADAAELEAALLHALAQLDVAQPDQELGRWSIDPARYRAEAIDKVSAELVEQARQSADLTRRAELLERVLSLAPTHAAALELLGGPPESRLAGASQSQPAVPVCPDPSQPAAEEIRRPRRRGWLIGVLAALGLAAAGTSPLWLAGSRDEARQPAASPRSDRGARPGSSWDRSGPRQPPQRRNAEVRADAGAVGAAPRPVPRDGATAAVSGKARGRARQLLRRVPPSRPGPAAPTEPATLRLSTAPWAEVIVDGRSVGFTPKLSSLELAPGGHHLELRNPMCQRRELRLQVNGGELLVRHVVLQVLPARVRLELPDGWKVTIDGKSAGVTPLPTLTLAHGRHQLRLTAPSSRSHQIEVQAVAGKTVTVHLD